MQFEFDLFNGVVIDTSTLPECTATFDDMLAALIDHSHGQKKQLMWLSLSITQAKFVEAATRRGFVFHNCLEEQLTLILRLVDNAYAPFTPTYSIGAGALVVNDKDEILVIRERLASGKGYKLPGGHVELGEKIADAVVREVFEETGIKAKFEGIQGFVTKENYRFGKSNMYFICRLSPQSSFINIMDPDEIEDAKWVSIDDYIQDDNNSPFNRQLVSELHKSKGLAAQPLENNTGPYAKLEAFFGHTS